MSTTLQNLVRVSELLARHWTTRRVGPFAGTWWILRGLARNVRIRKDAGNHTALWQEPSSGSRSTRIPRAQERVRGGRRQIVIAGAPALGQIGGRLRRARIGIAGIETAAAAGGRAKKDEETGEGTIVVVDARDVRAAKETVPLEATGISGRHERNERISKGCQEPQPWARPTMGRLRAPAAGTLLGARKPAELSKPPPVTVMRDPKATVASRFQDVASPAR